MPTDDTKEGALSRKRYLAALLWGGFGGAAVVALPYAAAILIKLFMGISVFSGHLLEPQLGISLLLILPFIQGAIAGLIAGNLPNPLKTCGGLGALMLLLDYLLAMLFLGEGVICLIMAFPLYGGIMGVGLATGRAFAISRNQRTFRAVLIPLAVLAVVIDTEASPPSYSNAISDAVTINAPPDRVWRYIVSYPDNTNPPDYWLWRIGLPMPVQSTASAAAIGAERQCRFTNGIAFDEQITEIVPNKVMTFKVTAQPNHPEIIGHFSLDKGQLYLEENPDGTTTVIATSWYRIFVRPAPYFDWWAEDIVRNIHFRVLNHMKELAEADNRSQAAMLED
ncbi:hypothetical protein [Aestuariivirga sp.]|uniref:hypothetical protein n=1 Tax=Aestuariivirga sp. TaxID=2650926 RepID=UPI0039E5190C